MIDYTKTLFYKITNPENKMFIGATTKTLSKTKYYYNIAIKNNKSNKLMDSFKQFGIDQHSFEEIEKCNCKDKDEVNKRLLELITLNDTINNGLNNNNLPYGGRTKKDWIKEYNKNYQKSEKYKQYKKNYHTQHTKEKAKDDHETVKDKAAERYDYTKNDASN